MFDRRLVALTIAFVMGFTAIAQPTLGTPAETRAGNALPGTPCPVGSVARSYGVTSLPLPVSYNHWGDLDLQGMLFLPNENVDPVLSDVEAKLLAAGIDPLAGPVGDMRAALAAGDVGAAAQAAQDLVAAAQTMEQAAPPRSRVDQTDLVQPLILRAHVGECVTVRLTNILPAATSIHAHALVTPPGEGEATGVQKADFAMPGQTHDYTMYIPPWASMEGAHFLHSHVDAREQTRHGLFGAIVAEPLGSLWKSTADGVTDAPTGLEAMIVVPNAPDFREFVQIYHDEIELVDWQLDSLPEISPFGEYGPGTKGINLRTEPFMDRFLYHDELRADGKLARGHDKSQSYGSYTYGDPSTWIQKSYLGDPVKFRTINAGPGQYHIHHLHGGGIRWKSTPMAEPSQFAIGLTKGADNVQATQSQRLDVQNMGPGESFNLEPEGGSGGVQQSVGDFLYHCHIAEHYLAGMWSIWRTYNTIQPGLAELPDRAGAHQPAVNSAALLGHVFPDGSVLDASNIDAWVQSFLPPPGVPGEEDASVWDWKVSHTAAGPVYLGEKETAFVWPDYPVDAPGRLSAGTRPEIGFDINTAKPAYPMLRPHLGARPPFAPEHSGAPFLKHSVTPQLPDGLCPSGARPIKYDVVAIQADVKYNKFDSDKAGQVFVRAQDRAAIDGGTADPTSIVLRGNAGDCIDVTLTSALNEKEPGEIATGVHTKTNIHIHLVQFDVQGSDGVVAGYNYETTLRSLNGSYKSKPGQTLGALDPSAQTVTKIAGAVGIVGTDTTFVVESVKPFLDKTGMPKIGSTVGLGLGLTSIESGKLLAVNNATKTITIQGIHQVHNVGEFLGYEFVRYQWYPDVELGTVYFHDHVNGIDTWRHGLFGSLVIEPTGSRWLDPKRLNDNVPDSPTAHVVDIVPDGSVPGQKAYREAVLHFQDRACVNAVATACLNHEVPAMPNVVDEPAGFNLRAEPLHRRNAEKPFSSTAFYGTDDPRTAAVETNLLQGDPSTDTIEAYPGDKVVVRFLYAGQSMSRGVATFGMTGHRFQQEQFLTGGRVVDALSVAVSSQHNLELECGAGGCTRQPGDYLYFMTQPEFLQRGAWGLFRVHDPSDLTPIRALPDHAAPTVGFVPASAPVKRFDVSAIEGSVAHNPNAGIVSTMKRFVLDSELPQATDIATLTPPDPLVLRVSAGDLVEVHLTNRLASGRVGMHAALLSAGPADQGVEVGNGPTATARPGETIVYSWYADRELGVADLVSFADPVNDANEGLSGAIVVEPAGVAFTNATGPTADLALPNDLVAREQVLLFATPDAQFQSSTMPYLPDAAGITMINYATEPLARRMGALVPAAAQLPPISGASVSSCHVNTADCMDGTHAWEVRNPIIGLATSGLAPWTPIVDAQQGQPVVLRVLGASGDQLATVHVDGHFFATDPEMGDCRNVLSTCRSNVVSTVTLGAREGRNLWIPAAGPAGPGDYMYRNHRDAYFEAGGWGLLRVHGPTTVPLPQLPMPLPVPVPGQVTLPTV